MRGEQNVAGSSPLGASFSQVFRIKRDNQTSYRVRKGEFHGPVSSAGPNIHPVADRRDGSLCPTLLPCHPVPPGPPFAALAFALQFHVLARKVRQH